MSAAAQPGLIASNPTLDAFCLKLRTKPDQEGVVVGFDGVPGNRPQRFGNTVALWDTWSPVLTGPETVAPLTVVPISGDEQPSAVYIDYGFAGTDYLITYQTSHPLTTMCAQLRLSLGMLAAVPPSSVSLSVSALDSTSVTVLYSTLAGYRPATFGNWIGVWQGFAGPYDAPTPDAWAPVHGDATAGLLTLSGIEVTPPLPYSVIYFMGPEADGVPGTNVGAALTFIAEADSTA